MTGMEKPLVSILIPTYEPDPVHLREALESVAHQTETHWKCLIHDDASQSDVPGVVRPYLSDQRFRFIRSSKRLGIGGNWNACLEHASDAPFVQYLFQDDTWHYPYLRHALDVFTKHPHVGFVAVDHEYRYEGNVPTIDLYEELRRYRREHIAPGVHRGSDFLQWWTSHELHPNVIGEPSFVMLRREVVQEIGPFREDMPQFLDVEYWLRCLSVADWYFLTEELGSFRVHPKGASAMNHESGVGIYDRLRCFEMLIRSLPPAAESRGLPLRDEAIAARNRALQAMVGKFFARLKEGKSVGAASRGRGFLGSFALRHPLLVGGAVLRNLKRTPS